jgi:hypothetical protein
MSIRLFERLILGYNLTLTINGYSHPSDLTEPQEANLIL